MSICSSCFPDEAPIQVHTLPVPDAQPAVNQIQPVSEVGMPLNTEVLAQGGLGDAPSNPEDRPAEELTHFTRYTNMSRDDFVDRVRGMINRGAFNHIGHAIIRLEGQTS